MSSTAHSKFIECRAVGTCDVQQVPNAIKHLRALCYHYSLHKDHRIAMRFPVRAGAQHSMIHLLRELDPSSQQISAKGGGWTLRFEGSNIRGKALELPASVREVAEATSTSSTIPEFWQSQGGTIEFEEFHDGQRYLVHYQGLNLVIDVMTARRINASGHSSAGVDRGPGIERKDGDKFVVEVTTRATNETYADAARTIGAFAPHLMPWVQLGHG